MKMIKKALPPVSAALCAVCMLLLLIDRIAPDLSLFLKPWVKQYILITCLTTIAASCVKLSRTRRRLRRKLARKGRP